MAARSWTRTGRKPRVEDLTASLFYEPGQRVPGGRPASHGKPAPVAADRFRFGAEGGKLHVEMVMEDGRFQPRLRPGRSRTSPADTIGRTAKQMQDFADAITSEPYDLTMGEYLDPNHRIDDAVLHAWMAADRDALNARALGWRRLTHGYGPAWAAEELVRHFGFEGHTTAPLGQDGAWQGVGLALDPHQALCFDVRTRRPLLYNGRDMTYQLPGVTVATWRLADDHRGKLDTTVLLSSDERPTRPNLGPRIDSVRMPDVGPPAPWLDHLNLNLSTPQTRTIDDVLRRVWGNW